MTSIFSKLFAKLFGKKKSPYRKTVELPKTAQDTIPFMEAYDNGLFLVDEDKPRSRPGGGWTTISF